MPSWLELLTGPTLTRLVFFPTIACLPLLFLRSESKNAIRIYALIVSLIELGFGIAYIASGFAPDGGFPRAHDPLINWLPTYGIHYDLQIDGISMPLVALTVLLLPIVILGSWRGIDKHWRGYTAAMLLLTTGVIGSLTSYDIFLFYVFWEVMLIPMYLIIGIWGGERRIYAAVKFFLFTMAGSLLMLVAILWLAWIFHGLTGTWSFAYQDLLRLNIPLRQQIWLFGAFALAFLIKVPV